MVRERLNRLSSCLIDRVFVYFMYGVDVSDLDILVLIDQNKTRARSVSRKLSTLTSVHSGS